MEQIGASVHIFPQLQIFHFPLPLCYIIDCRESAVLRSPAPFPLGRACHVQPQMASQPCHRARRVSAMPPRYFSPPLLCILLLLFLNHIDFISAAATQCYDPSGAVKSIDAPCYLDASVSICCAENWGEWALFCLEGIEILTTVNISMHQYISLYSRARRHL